MNLKKGFLIITALLTFSFSARKPGATFLLIPSSARATAMAYAYTAVCDDASANYYNAAGLAFIEKPKITVDYCEYLPGLHPDMYHIYLGAAAPFQNSTWGFDMIYFTCGKTDVFDENGIYLGEAFAWRTALRINYARKLDNKFSFGIGGKYVYLKYVLWSPWVYNYIGLYDHPGSSLAFDFNVLYKILPSLSVGSVLHNIGFDVRHSETGASSPLPRLYRLGIAYRPVDNKDFKCTLSAEITKLLIGMFADEENSSWENLKYEFKEAWKGIGLELTFYKIVSLRGGYFHDEEGAGEGFTFGGGINIKKFELDIGIDEHIFDFETRNRKISLSYTF